MGQEDIHPYGTVSWNEIYYGKFIPLIVISDLGYQTRHTLCQFQNANTYFSKNVPLYQWKSCHLTDVLYLLSSYLRDFQVLLSFHIANGESFGNNFHLLCDFVCIYLINSKAPEEKMAIVTTCLNLTDIYEY